MVAYTQYLYYETREVIQTHLQLEGKSQRFSYNLTTVTKK